MPPSSADAYKSLTAYKPRTTADVMQESEAKYDIPGITGRLSKLRGLVGNLQSSVEAVDPSVTGRTSGTFTTEAQRQALVNRERTPILSDLSKQQGFLSDTQSEFGTAQSLASQMASALLTEDNRTYQRLLDQYNAARAAEQEAEARRQFEETQKLERERLAASERQARIAAGGGGYDVGSILSTITGGNTTNSEPQKRFIGNDDARGRWAYEAQQGDRDAKWALKYLDNEGRYDGPVASPEAYEALKRVGAVGNFYVIGNRQPSNPFESIIKLFGGQL